VIEIVGDLWHYHREGAWCCITTNGYVKRDGRLVMGRGCAQEAAQRFPDLQHQLGDLVARKGNHVFPLAQYTLLSFPVKHTWDQRADLDLIRRSAEELMALLADPFSPVDPPVILPRPGCGNGGLLWRDVAPILEGILDQRVQVLCRPFEALA